MAQGSAPAGPGNGSQRPSLPPIREDLRLYPGPTQRDGSPSWRILDPVRNSFFEIGWLEFELLARWRMQRDPEALLAQVAAETTLEPSAEELEDLLQFLAVNQLLAPQKRHGAADPRPSPGRNETCVVLAGAAPLPVFPPAAFQARRVPRSHRSADRRVLHPRLRDRGADAAGSRPVPGVARVVQRDGRDVAHVHGAVVPVLRDRRELLQSDPRARARLCGSTLWRARAHHGGRVPRAVAVPVHGHERDVEARRPPQAAGHRLGGHELGAGARRVLDFLLGARSRGRHEACAVRSRQHHLDRDARDQHEPIHALRRLFRAVGPARLPQLARAQLRVRALVDAHHFFRPGRTHAGAGPAPGAARRPDRLRLADVALPAGRIPRRRAAGLSHRLQAARHLPDVGRADLVRRPAGMAGARSPMEVAQGREDGVASGHRRAGGDYRLRVDRPGLVRSQRAGDHARARRACGLRAVRGQGNRGARSGPPSGRC